MTTTIFGRDPTRPRLLTPAFTALLAAQASFGFAFSTFLLLPKFLVVQFDATPDEIGVVIAVHGVAVVLLLPVVGDAVDRLGRRRFLTAGGLLMAVSTLAFTAVDSIGPLLYGLRVVHAVAFAMAFAAGGALAVDAAPPERLAQAVGLFGLSFLSMNAIAPAVAETLATAYGWEAAFLAAAMAALVCAVLSLRVPDRHRPRSIQTEISLGTIVLRPVMRRGCMVVALVGVALCAVFAFQQPYALDLGYTRVRDFFVAYAITAILVRTVFGHWLDHLGHRRAATIALVIYPFVTAAVARIDVLGLVAIGIGVAVAHGMLYPSLNAVVLTASRPDERGRVMAIFQSAFNCGFGLGGLGLGYLASAAGYPATFVAAAIAVALGLVGILTMPETPSPPAPAPARPDSEAGASPRRG